MLVQALPFSDVGWESTLGHLLPGSGRREMGNREDPLPEQGSGVYMHGIHTCKLCMHSISIDPYITYTYAPQS